tara:strand:+ start:30999 stop:32888 length:1890 start_codon:yes stop_codon:yes gene_type:complete
MKYKIILAILLVLPFIFSDIHIKYDWNDSKVFDNPKAVEQFGKNMADPEFAASAPKSAVILWGQKIGVNFALGNIHRYDKPFVITKGENGVVFNPMQFSGQVTVLPDGSIITQDGSIVKNAVFSKEKSGDRLVMIRGIIIDSKGNTITSSEKIEFKEGSNTYETKGEVQLTTPAGKYTLESTDLIYLDLTQNEVKITGDGRVNVIPENKDNRFNFKGQVTIEDQDRYQFQSGTLLKFYQKYPEQSADVEIGKTTKLCFEECSNKNILPSSYGEIPTIELLRDRAEKDILKISSIDSKEKSTLKITLSNTLFGAIYTDVRDKTAIELIQEGKTSTDRRYYSKAKITSTKLPVIKGRTGALLQGDNIYYTNNAQFDDNHNLIDGKITIIDATGRIQNTLDAESEFNLAKFHNGDIEVKAFEERGNIANAKDKSIEAHLKNIANLKQALFLYFMNFGEGELSPEIAQVIEAMKLIDPNDENAMKQGIDKLLMANLNILDSGNDNPKFAYVIEANLGIITESFNVPGAGDNFVQFLMFNYGEDENLGIILRSHKFQDPLAENVAKDYYVRGQLSVIPANYGEMIEQFGPGSPDGVAVEKRSLNNLLKYANPEQVDEIIERLALFEEFEAEFEN